MVGLGTGVANCPNVASFWVRGRRCRTRAGRVTRISAGLPAHRGRRAVWLHQILEVRRAAVVLLGCPAHAGVGPSRRQPLPSGRLLTQSSRTEDPAGVPGDVPRSAGTMEQPSAPAGSRGRCPNTRHRGQIHEPAGFRAIGWIVGVEHGNATLLTRAEPPRAGSPCPSSALPKPPSALPKPPSSQCGAGSLDQAQDHLGLRASARAMSFPTNSGASPSTVPLAGPQLRGAAGIITGAVPSKGRAVHRRRRAFSGSSTVRGARSNSRTARRARV